MWCCFEKREYTKERIGEGLGLSDHEWTSFDSLIGSGPYKLVYWRTDEEVKIERFDEYFEPPNFKYFTWTYYTGKEPLFEAFKAGELNLYEKEGLLLLHL